MTEYLLEPNGTVKAFCEWNLLDENGHFNDKGEQCWIQEIYVAPPYRNNGMMSYFINLISNKAPTAKYCRFRRRINPNETTDVKKFSREEITRRT